MNNFAALLNKWFEVVDDVVELYLKANNIELTYENIVKYRKIIIEHLSKLGEMK